MSLSKLTYKGVEQKLKTLFFMLCAAFLLSGIAYTYSGNSEGIAIEEECNEGCSIRQGNNDESVIKIHFNRYRKKYFIATRRFSFGYFLKDATDYIFTVVHAPIDGFYSKYFGPSFHFPRPFYYTFLFLYALF